MDRWVAFVKAMYEERAEDLARHIFEMQETKFKHFSSWATTVKRNIRLRATEKFLRHQTLKRAAAKALLLWDAKTTRRKRAVENGRVVRCKREQKVVRGCTIVWRR